MKAFFSLLFSIDIIAFILISRFFQDSRIFSLLLSATIIIAIPIITKIFPE